MIPNIANLVLYVASNPTPTFFQDRLQPSLKVSIAALRPRVETRLLFSDKCEMPLG